MLFRSAGDTSDILTVQLQDTYFNPAVRTVNTVFTITSDTTGIFRDSLNQNNIVVAIIPAGESEISFRYTSLVAGTHTISVNDTVTDFHLTGDSQELIVTPRLASKIVFINPERTILAGDTSEILTIQLQDIYDNIAVSDEDRGILLETDPTGFFLDSLNVEEIIGSTLQIPIGRSEISFWFSSTQAGIHQLSATDTTLLLTPLLPGNQNLTVNALDAIKIAFVSPDSTIAAGDTSDIITLQLQDIYNNAAIRSVETGIALQTNAAVTLRDSANVNTITEVSIAENTSEAWIRYTATIPGVYKLFANDTATANTLTGDSLNLTVIAAAPDKIVLISGPSSMSAGDTSAIFTIQLQDFYNNVALSNGLTSVRLLTDLTGVFRDSLNLLDVTQVDITDGQSEKSFRYTSTLAAVHQLSASDLNIVSPLDSAYWNFTINPLSANKIAFIKIGRAHV